MISCCLMLPADIWDTILNIVTALSVLCGWVPLPDTPVCLLKLLVCASPTANALAGCVAPLSRLQIRGGRACTRRWLAGTVRSFSRVPYLRRLVVTEESDHLNVLDVQAEWVETSLNISDYTRTCTKKLGTTSKMPYSIVVILNTHVRQII